MLTLGIIHHEGFWPFGPCCRTRGALLRLLFLLADWGWLIVGCGPPLGVRCLYGGAWAHGPPLANGHMRASNELLSQHQHGTQPALSQFSLNRLSSKLAENSWANRLSYSLIHGFHLFL